MKRTGVIALTISLVTIALMLWYLWPTLRRDGFLVFSPPEPSKIEYPIRGIDISAHNGEIDFQRLAADSLIDFAYIKATEGTDFLDRNFIANARGMQSIGIDCGAYHFFRFDTDGYMQALNFINALEGRNFTLPPAIDVEEWGNPKGYSTQHILKELRAMLNEMRRQGYSPIIYSNKDGYHRFIQGRLNDMPLWICSFTDPPLRPSELHSSSATARPSAPGIVIWQYSHRGSIPGISGPVDLNAAPALPQN